MSIPHIPQAPAKPSLGTAFNWSFEWMKGVLFPFDFNRWLAYALGAWLMLLGGGGGSFNFGSGGNSGGGGGRGGPTSQDLNESAVWLQNHLPLIIGITVVAVVLILLLQALFKWLGARGHFIFLFGLINNQPLIKEPWSRYRNSANSLAKFHYLLFLATFLPFLALLAVLLFRYIQLASEPNTSLGPIFGQLLLLLLLLFLPILLLLIPLAVIRLFADDFLVPLMFRDGLNIGAAWHRFAPLLSANKGDFFVYFLARLLVAFCVNLVNGLLVFFACCLTCGIALLPVLSAMPMLPGLVFRRFFPIAYLEQFGPEWSIFPRQEYPPAPTQP